MTIMTGIQKSVPISSVPPYSTHAPTAELLLQLVNVTRELDRGDLSLSSCCL